MKVKELIEKLKEYNQNLEVVLWTDHGQTLMKADTVQETYVHDLEEYMLEEDVPEDEDDKEEMKEIKKRSIKVLNISAL